MESKARMTLKNWRVLAALLALSVLVSPFANSRPQDVGAQGTTPSADEIIIGLQEVYSGFEQPTQIASAGDGSGRLFISERRGRVHVSTATGISPTPFLDIEHLVKSDDGEQALLGIVFHPEFPADDRVFVAYTREPDGAYLLDSFTVAEGSAQADLDSRATILVIEQPTSLHNGGGLAFGPDGYLYLGLGDGGPGGDPFETAQDLTTPLGKILRIDVNTPTGYAIPSDNPFVGIEDYRPEIWASGLRNPWRISFDSLTGDLFIGDVGSGNWEEINVQAGGSEGGQNYGWSIMEGNFCWPPDRGCNAEGLTLPTEVYGHDVGCSVTGGEVYRGDLSSGASGLYLYGDWCSGTLWGMRQDAEGLWQTSVVRETDLMIVSFGSDDSGELYVADYREGGIYRLVFYEHDPSISISSTSPEALYAGATAATVTITGSGFTESSVVQWQGREVITIFDSDQQLRALLGQDDLAFSLGFEGTREVGIAVANAGPDPAISAPYLVPVEMFGQPLFQPTWERTDALVASGDVDRTWMWGPVALTGPLEEPYAEAPGGVRTVQYFDKSRMEYPNPQADPDSIWAVTNGLLVVELITGQMQTGDASFEPRQPSRVNVAGDQGSTTSPVYATFVDLLDETGDETGRIVTERIDQDGAIADDRSLIGQEITYQYFDEISGHNIAGPFWEFMISEATVYVDGEPVVEPLFTNPFFATGRPITEAYWAEVPVKGVDHLVLMQCFERRCLTYTSQNEPGWQVEAGNVGQHYYAWRYLNR